VAVILVALVIPITVGADPARASHGGNRGETYRQALAAKAAAARAVDERTALERKDGYIERQTRYWSSVYGRSTGRWFRLVHTYWPRSEWPRAMRCIYLESGGHPDAHGPYGSVGLFQLLGYSCRPWNPETNVRLAAKLWRARGWAPWTTMRGYW
jgi:hypothetical protein